MRDYPQGGVCPSGQRGRAVNPLALAFEGSNPSAPSPAGQVSGPRVLVRTPRRRASAGSPFRGAHRPSIPLCGFSLPRYTSAAL